MRINIGGDFCITSQYLSKQLISKSVKALFDDSDLNILNLECPIVNKNNHYKIIKTGPHLKTDERILNYLKQLNTNVVTLANNHILDYGLNGLKTTLEHCNKNNIQYVGAEMSVKQAAQPLIIEKGGLKIAFVNFCENEWSVANSQRGGANPMDIIDNYKQIKNAKQKVDFVIVIVHGGHEYYSLPSPRMVKQYRFYAENGADAVIGHHTHSISGYEIYNKVPIVYSLGNFLFTIPNKNKKWYNGLVAQLTLQKGEPIDLQLIPIQQNEEDFELTIIDDANKKLVLKYVNELNVTIQDNNELHQEWRNYLLKQSKLINTLSPINYIPNKYIAASLKRIGINKLLINNKYLKSLANRIRCEAHRDLIIDTLLNRVNKNK